ncbi:MAG: hypothetical protein WCO97_03240 [bacterium]
MEKEPKLESKTLVGYIVEGYRAPPVVQVGPITSYVFPAFSYDDAEGLWEECNEGEIISISATYYFDELDQPTITVQTNGLSLAEVFDLVEKTLAICDMAPWLQVKTSKRPIWDESLDEKEMDRLRDVVKKLKGEAYISTSRQAV